MNICLEFYWDEEEKKAKIKHDGSDLLVAAYSNNPVSVVDFLEDCNKFIAQEYQDALMGLYTKAEFSR